MKNSFPLASPSHNRRNERLIDGKKMAKKHPHQSGIPRHRKPELPGRPEVAGGGVVVRRFRARYDLEDELRRLGGRLQDLDGFVVRQTQ